VVARIWSARTSASGWIAYQRHFIEKVVPELRAVHGYVFSNLLKRETGGEIEITVITVWRSLEAVTTFAGDDREAAVVAPDAAALLTDYDRRVRHYEVAYANSVDLHPG
jgi:heme-degrading monooxygenase HmoA